MQPPFGDRDRVKTSYFEEELGVLNLPAFKDGPAKRVHVAPNPCMFRVNEVLFGVCSNDVLFALSSEEISVTPEGTNRLTRLAAHLLQQQSFMPLFPAPGQQIDLRQSRHWEMKSFSPDVLIIPSKLTALAKDVRLSYFHRLLLSIMPVYV